MPTINTAKVTTDTGAQHSLHETIDQANAAAAAANEKAVEMGLTVRYESGPLDSPVAG